MELYVEAANRHISAHKTGKTSSQISRRNVDLLVLRALDGSDLDLEYKLAWFDVVLRSSAFTSFWMGIKFQYQLPESAVEPYMLKPELTSYEPSTGDLESLVDSEKRTVTPPEKFGHVGWQAHDANIPLDKVSGGLGGYAEQLVRNKNLDMSEIITGMEGKDVYESKVNALFDSNKQKERKSRAAPDAKGRKRVGAVAKRAKKGRLGMDQVGASYWPIGGKQ